MGSKVCALIAYRVSTRSRRSERLAKSTDQAGDNKLHKNQNKSAKFGDKANKVIQAATGRWRSERIAEAAPAQKGSQQRELRDRGLNQTCMYSNLRTRKSPTVQVASSSWRRLCPASGSLEKAGATRAAAVAAAAERTSGESPNKAESVKGVEVLAEQGFLLLVRKVFQFFKYFPPAASLPMAAWPDAPRFPMPPNALWCQARRRKMV